jgi:hypothetical protein
MTIKYFTGSNLDTRNTKVSGDVKTYPTSRSGKTTGDLTSLGLPETEPSATDEDGIDVKPNRTVDSTVASKYVRIRRKVYAKTGDTYGKTGAQANCNKGVRVNYGAANPATGTPKTRVSALKGKYEHGKMWKYRKTLKRLMTDIGFTAQNASVGERNMFNGKNIGRIGNYKSIEDANDQCLYPLSGLK